MLLILYYEIVVRMKENESYRVIWHVESIPELLSAITVILLYHLVMVFFGGGPSVEHLYLNFVLLYL